MSLIIHTATDDGLIVGNPINLDDYDFTQEGDVYRLIYELVHRINEFTTPQSQVPKKGSARDKTQKRLMRGMIWDDPEGQEGV